MPASPEPTELRRNGIDRRALLRWSAGIAGVLALPAIPYGLRIADAMQAAAESATRLPVLWLRGQGCDGNIESFLRASQPTPSELLLNRLSMEYVELLMAPAGKAAETRLADAIHKNVGQYVLVVEGSVPTGSNGAFCCSGGRPFTQVVAEAASGALAVIAAGSCATDGGLPATTGGVTGAVSLAKFLTQAGIATTTTSTKPPSSSATSGSGSSSATASGSPSATPTGSATSGSASPSATSSSSAAASSSATASSSAAATPSGAPGSASPTAAAAARVAAAAVVPRLLTFPGCPTNVENITAAIVQYLTLGEWPETDATGLPLFAYGAKIHPKCERLPFLKAGKVALAWGDEGHRAGWCLRRIGCQGPLTPGNCSTVKFNSATSWPVASGSPCIGCTRPNFWDELEYVVDWTPPAPATTTPATSTTTSPATAGSTTPTPATAG